jgi:hypothetical protein
MTDRPPIDKNLSGDTFRSFYYLKEELTAFCRKEGLQATGGKIDLTNRIAHYLDTGEKISEHERYRRDPHTDTVTEDALIGDGFVCSEKHRAFFVQMVGKFTFNVTFQKWLRSNPGKTYKEAVETYNIILADKKNNRSVIGEQFEYNTYIRDFFKDNKGRPLSDAIKCWRYKKSIRGHNGYEKADLIALE